jgi:hypothetical protein
MPPFATAASSGGVPSVLFSLSSRYLRKFTRARWARISLSTPSICRLNSVISPSRRRKNRPPVTLMTPSAPAKMTQTIGLAPCVRARRAPYMSAYVRDLIVRLT